jgi:ketosteroid isomerase-like protein
VVRKPLRVREQSSRTLEQRIALRFPALTRPGPRLVGALPPRSRVRRTMVSRYVRQGIEAYNRRDLDAAATAFHPRLEYYPYREFVEAGLAEPCYRGRAGYKAYIEATYEVWGGDVLLYPTELIDMGSRLVLLADMPMRAQASGIPLAQHYATIAALEGGQIIRQQDYLDQAEALAAAGL